MRNERRAIQAMGFLVASLVLCACADRPDAAGGGHPGAAPDGHRVVVMAPAAAEMLEALGALDVVVGVGDFVQEPASIAELPVGVVTALIGGPFFLYLLRTSRGRHGF